MKITMKILNEQTIIVIKLIIKTIKQILIKLKTIKAEEISIEKIILTDKIISTDNMVTIIDRKAITFINKEVITMIDKAQINTIIEIETTNKFENVVIIIRVGQMVEIWIIDMEITIEDIKTKKDPIKIMNHLRYQER